MASFSFSLVVTFLVASLLLYLLLSRVLPVSHSNSSHQPQHLPLPPGPRGWPVLGNLPQLGPKPHQTLAAMSRTYGALFHLRLGSIHVVVASSPAVAAAFLKTHDANFSNRPFNTGAKYMAYDCQDLVWAPYGPHWRMLRRICTHHLFSPRALDDSAHVRREEVAALARALADAAGRGVDVGQLLTVCTANVLTRVMLGRRLFVVTEGRGGGGGGGGDAATSGEGVYEEVRQFKEMTVELNALAGVFMVGDFIPALRWLDSREVVERMKRMGKRYDQFLDGIIAEHLATRDERNPQQQQHEDMLNVLIGLKEDADHAGAGGGGEGVKLTDTTIKGLLVDLFTAGTDTSSSTLEWVLAELIRHPDILEAARRELDAVVGLDRLVAESDLPAATLVQAIVKETLRLHPPTPLSLPHVASEACEVAGYGVPGGSTLIVNVWAIGRDPSVWGADALEFRPSRFLPGGPQAHVDVRGNNFEAIPFGAGRRICAGMSLALRMVHLMAATLIHAFEWALPPGQAAEKLDMGEAYGLTLQRAVPLHVHPNPRLAPRAYSRTVGAP